MKPRAIRLYQLHHSQQVTFGPVLATVKLISKLGTT